MANPGVCVRRETSDDVERLSAFAAAIFPSVGPPDADPGDLADYIAAELTAECFRILIENPNTILFVAGMADQIFGYAAALRPSPHPQIEVLAAELLKFCVGPAYHGRGVTDELMHQAPVSLERDCLTVVWLSVYWENRRAIASYKKRGFHIVGAGEHPVRYLRALGQPPVTFDSGHK